MIADVRNQLTESRFGNLTKSAGKICPTCNCQARAKSSPREYTYFYFPCGAPGYKQSRSKTAISVLRQGRQTAPVGCGSN
jgi:hypothetical protein